MAAIAQRINHFFFYNVFIGSISAVLASRILFSVLNKNKRIDSIIQNLSISIAGLITFGILSTLPLTIDRSFSVWMIKNLASQNQEQLTLSRSRLLSEATDFFSPSNGELSRRINEQLRLGNIEEKNFRLTKKGTLIAHLNDFIGKFFDLDPKYSRIPK